MQERFHFKKSLGQHFLRDEHVIDQIVKAIQPHPSQHFVEIGPGQGALTTHLLPLVNKIDVIEYDKTVIPLLQQRCKQLGHLVVHQMDVLAFNFHQLFEKNMSYRIVGNLPYNISTPLLFHLLPFTEFIQDMTFMLQQEVAERITAIPHTKSYGRLSVMLQYYCEVTYLFSVPPSAFYPPPRVNSAIIHLKPYHNRTPKVTNERLFSELVKNCFNFRRKTLRNALKNYINSDSLSFIPIDLQSRAEDLTVEEFIQLANFIDIRQ